MVELAKVADNIAPANMTKLLEALFENDINEPVFDGLSKKYPIELDFLMKLLGLTNNFDEMMEKVLKFGVIDTVSELYGKWVSSWNV